MPVVPIGSLMHGGFGAHLPVFTDVNGNLLTPTATQVEAQSTPLLFDSAGRLAISSGWNSGQVEIFAPDLVTVLGLGTPTSGYAAQYITTPNGGRYYVASRHTSIPIVHQVDVFDTTGALLRNIILPTGPEIATVSMDEAFIYWSSANVGNNTVGKLDLSSMAAANIITFSGRTVNVTANSIIALNDGTILVSSQSLSPVANQRVGHYTNTGTLIMEYLIPQVGSGPAGIFLTSMAKGLTDATFWEANYDDNVGGQNLVYFREYDVATGAVVNLFTKPEVDPTFEWDGDFTVVRGGGLPPTTPPTTLVNSTPCCGAVPGTPNAGPVATPTETSQTGWIPSCTGGAIVPSAPDIVLAERWDY